MLDRTLDKMMDSKYTLVRLLGLAMFFVQLFTDRKFIAAMDEWEG